MTSPKNNRRFADCLDRVVYNLREAKPRALLSQVKQTILHELWGDGSSFPGHWIKSQHLLNLTGQKYFDRRIRELRNEVGCDIETGNVEGSPVYRLKSTELSTPYNRSYLGKTRKAHLFDTHDHRCAVCGQQFSKLTKGLEADHKVPLIRGGSADLENWQPLCVACNINKRRSCQGCQLKCENCAWAFPEKFGGRLLLKLDAQLLESISLTAHRKGIPVEDAIACAIEHFLESRKK